LHERKLHPSPDLTMSKVTHISQGNRINRLQCSDCRLGYDATSSDRNLSNFLRNELPRKKTFGSKALKTTWYEVSLKVVLTSHLKCDPLRKKKIIKKSVQILWNF
jgi:hypothetical protein